MQKFFNILHAAFVIWIVESSVAIFQILVPMRVHSFVSSLVDICLISCHNRQNSSHNCEKSRQKIARHQPVISNMKQMHVFVGNIMRDPPKDCHTSHKTSKIVSVFETNGVVNIRTIMIEVSDPM